MNEFPWADKLSGDLRLKRLIQSVELSDDDVAQTADQHSGLFKFWT